MTFVIDLLAVYRLTRLLTEDELMEPVREWVWKNHPPQDTKIGYFVTCPWCVSVWVGGAVVAARMVAPRQWDPIARALVLSAGTGLIASKV